MYSSDELFQCLREGYFGVYFPSNEAMSEINTQITLEWAQKQFVTRVHTLSLIDDKMKRVVWGSGGRRRGGALGEAWGGGGGGGGGLRWEVGSGWGGRWEVDCSQTIIFLAFADDSWIPITKAKLWGKFRCHDVTMPLCAYVLY